MKSSSRSRSPGTSSVLARYTVGRGCRVAVHYLARAGVEYPAAMPLQERRRQTEQAGRGVVVIIPFRPAASVRGWKIHFIVGPPRLQRTSSWVRGSRKIRRNLGGYPQSGQSGLSAMKYTIVDNEIITIAALLPARMKRGVTVTAERGRRSGNRGAAGDVASKRDTTYLDC